MTTQKLNKELNKLLSNSEDFTINFTKISGYNKVSKFKGETIEFRELDNKMQEIVNVFKEYNIRYSCWNILYKSKDVYENKLFNLKIESKDDKRCKYIRKGKILGIRFVPYNEDILEINCQDLRSFLMKKDLEHDLENQKIYIEDLQDKLQKAKIDKENIEAELEKYI